MRLASGLLVMAVALVTLAGCTALDAEPATAAREWLVNGSHRRWSAAVALTCHTLRPEVLRLASDEMDLGGLTPRSDEEGLACRAR